jgi:hypothetical protein
MKGAKYFSGLYLIEMYKQEIVYDKPIVCWYIYSRFIVSYV